MIEFQVWILKSGAVCMILKYSHRFYFQKVLRTKKLQINQQRQNNQPNHIGSFSCSRWPTVKGNRVWNGTIRLHMALQQTSACSSVTRWRHLVWPRHIFFKRVCHFGNVEMLQRGKKINGKDTWYAGICCPSDTFTCPRIEGQAVMHIGPPRGRSRSSPEVFTTESVPLPHRCHLTPCCEACCR